MSSIHHCLLFFHITLLDNNGGNEGATALGEMLKVNPTLTELKLGNIFDSLNYTFFRMFDFYLIHSFG